MTSKMEFGINMTATIALGLDEEKGPPAGSRQSAKWKPLGLMNGQMKKLLARREK